MISNSTLLSPSKTQQLGRFLEAPTPQSLLEPHPDRDCSTHLVYSARQDDGGFQLIARSRHARHPVPSDELANFLDAMAQELRAHKGKHADAALARMRQTLLQWNGAPPTVAQLRQLNQTLHQQLDAVADADSDFQRRKRAQVALATFDGALQQRLRALPPKDPQRQALQQAGERLSDMLAQADTTLSFKGLSPDDIQALLDSGLLARFAALREGLAPAPERLVVPTGAQGLIGHLTGLPIRSLVLV